MVRLFLEEFLIVGLFVICFVYYLNERKRKLGRRFPAKFIGGPLDKKTKHIPAETSTYVYKHYTLPGDAVYKYRGDGLYEFDEYVQGGF